MTFCSELNYYPGGKYLEHIGTTRRLLCRRLPPLHRMDNHHVLHIKPGRAAKAANYGRSCIAQVEFRATPEILAIQRLFGLWRPNHAPTPRGEGFLAVPQSNASSHARAFASRHSGATNKANQSFSVELSVLYLHLLHLMCRTPFLMRSDCGGCWGHLYCVHEDKVWPFEGALEVRKVWGSSSRPTMLMQGPLLLTCRWSRHREPRSIAEPTKSD